MPAIPDLTRDHFPKLILISYQHVNNVVYFSYFDTAVNQNLVEHGLLSIGNSDVVGLVVSNQCQFFASISFPDTVYVGLSVEKIGHSSVTYRLGIFKNNENSLSALGTYTHVYVDRNTQRPVAIPLKTREMFESLLIER